MAPDRPLYIAMHRAYTLESGADALLPKATLGVSLQRPRLAVKPSLTAAISWAKWVATWRRSLCQSTVSLSIRMRLSRTLGWGAGVGARVGLTTPKPLMS